MGSVRGRLGEKWGVQAWGMGKEFLHSVSWMVQEGGWPVAEGEIDEGEYEKAEAASREATRKLERKRKAEGAGGQARKDPPQQKKGLEEADGGCERAGAAPAVHGADGGEDRKIGQHHRE